MKTDFVPFLQKAIGIVLMTLISACSFSGDEDHVRVAVIDGDQGVINPVGIELSYASSSMRASIARSLVGLDEQGRVVPALAARWIVTDDGLSYIFRLGEAKWDDGRQVTSERIKRLLQERIVELRRSRLGNQLSAVDEVISMTGRVVEIRLKAPNPNFLQLLAQPEMGLFRNGHGAGPMTLQNDEGAIQLGPLGDPSLDQDANEDEDDRWVRLRKDDAAKAIARYDAGYVDVVLDGKFHDLPLVAQADISSSDLRLDPVAGLFGLKFVAADGFWADAKNRKILSMVIDRPTLLSSFPGVTAWQSRVKIIPEALDVEGINTYPDWSANTLEDRRVFARDHIQRWAASEGAVKPLLLWVPDASGADILFLRLRSDLRRVGLDARRVNDAKDAYAVLIDEVAPYDSARWFLSRLGCAQTAICLKNADDMLALGDSSLSLVQKVKFYAEAEKVLVDHYNYIPLATPVRWSLAKPAQRGFAVNQRGWHPLNNLVGIPIS